MAEATRQAELVIEDAGDNLDWVYTPFKYKALI